MKAPTNGVLPNSAEGERKSINSELWHACAGPLVSLPPVGSLVVYFPQGHSEQVAASMQKETSFVPSYPNLPSKLICLLQNVTMHADTETDEVYAQMTLQPVTKYDKEALIASDMALKHSRQPAEFFCKTLTASDTSTHGGFSVPRRAAEKIFPPLDFSMQPPAQELGAKDIHDNTWAFRHIYRGQPKRHLLTTGWSVFVSTKRLSAGDSVLFIRDGKQLFLGIRPANRQQSALSSSVISSDSMHIGILAAAAHAAANNSPFTIFYNPRASPSEFVVPLAKYSKAMYAQVSLGMRFRMMFETEESGVRRYMGTITGISDLDPVRWKHSQWRSLQVGWDESTTGERPSRVSIWDIEPVVAPFYICPPPFFRPRFPKQPGMLDDESDIGSAFKRAMPWLGDDFATKDTPSTFLPGLSLAQWMSMQQTNQFPVAQSGTFPMMLASTADDPSKLLNFQAPASSASNSLFNKPNGNLANQLSPPLPLPQQQQLQQLLQNPSNQQQLQQLLQNPMNQQQLQQILQTPMNQQQQLQQPQQHLQQQQPQQAQQQKLQQLQQQLQQQSQQPLQQLQQHLLDHQQSPSHQRPSQQLQMQQASLSSQTNNGMVIPNQVPNQNIQHAIYTHGQQTQLLTSNTKSALSATKTSYPLTTLPQDLRQQQILEQKPSFTERYQQQTQLHQSPVQVSQQSLSEKAQEQPPLQQLIQQGLSEQQIRLQLLHKLQQQTPQLPSPSGSLLQGQMLQHQISQQNHQLAPLPASQNQQQLCSGNGFSTSALLPSQQLLVNQHLSQNRSVPGIRSHSGLTDGDPPSCSTSPSTNNCQVSPTKFVNRNGHGLAVLPTDPVIEPVNSLLQELQSKPDNQMKNELPRSKASDQVKYRNSAADQLEASSSGASYCLDNGSAQQNYSLPTFLDGDAQSHPRGNLPFTGNIGGMAPDTLLSKGYDSQKDLQNLLTAYGGAPKDIETELSTAGISSQSFSVPNMSFKAGYSNDVPLNEAGILSGGLWANQTPRMRTYTKVQKRGSVGRSIDVTRYKGYDELRHDLARMFGIEGQLEDPQCSDWKLVYVDHEKDILLVGDDPWEEFVSCVQSIKILSSAEVQQMSLDGDLGNAAFPNQACSGTDSGNAWRHYDENSAVSFNR